MNTLLKFKKRTSKSKRAAVYESFKALFPRSRLAPDGIVVCHKRRDVSRVVWLFMLRHRYFTEITSA